MTPASDGKPSKQSGLVTTLGLVFASGLIIWGLNWVYDEYLNQPNLNFEIMTNESKIITNPYFPNQTQPLEVVRYEIAVGNNGTESATNLRVTLVAPEPQQIAAINETFSTERTELWLKCPRCHIAAMDTERLAEEGTARFLIDIIWTNSSLYGKINFQIYATYDQGSTTKVLRGQDQPTQSIPDIPYTAVVLILIGIGAFLFFLRRRIFTWRRIRKQAQLKSQNEEKHR